MTLRPERGLVLASTLGVRALTIDPQGVERQTRDLPVGAGRGDVVRGSKAQHRSNDRWLFYPSKAGYLRFQ